MAVLQNKIDFAVILRVKNANPNGDPLNGNRPRTNYENYGEITDVCIKRKIRDRMVERYQSLQKEGKPTEGQSVFVQSDDRKIDDAKSLRARAEAALGNKLGSDKTVELACANWIDVRAFGQLFALKSTKGAKKKGESEDEGDTGVSIGIRGPVGYQATRQSGSHVRLTCESPEEHHLTIPLHDPLRVGTLAAILADVAAHHRLTRDAVVAKLFG